MDFSDKELEELAVEAREAVKAEVRRRLIENILKKHEDRINFFLGAAAEQLEPVIKKLFPL